MTCSVSTNYFTLSTKVLNSIQRCGYAIITVFCSIKARKYVLAFVPFECSIFILRNAHLALVQIIDDVSAPYRSLVVYLCWKL